MKKRDTNTESIGQVIQLMVDRLGLRTGLEDARIKQVWEDFLGKELALSTKWMKIKDGVLFAQMKDSITRHEVAMQKTALLQQLNESLGEKRIREIRLM